MEILKILQEHQKDLYPEDLDFFETELATGGTYDAAYQAQCGAMIRQIRTWMADASTNDGNNGAGSAVAIQKKPDDGKAGNPSGEKKVKAGKSGVMLGIADIAPEEALPTAAVAMSPEQRFLDSVVAIRDASDYKKSFRKHVKESKVLDEAFLESHFSFFQPWEVDVIVASIPLSEEFLEKYFNALDHDKIARYQLFSEGFFMKHFGQMDASTVLERGKNEWRKKENRSKQLDVFLRLKGVKK